VSKSSRFGERTNNLLGSSNDESNSPADSAHSQTKGCLEYGEDCTIPDVPFRNPKRDGSTNPLSSISADAGQLLSGLLSTLSITPMEDLDSFLGSDFPLGGQDTAESQYISSDEYQDLIGSNNGNEEPILLWGDPDRPMISITKGILQTTSPSPFNEICLFSSFESSKLTSHHSNSPELDPRSHAPAGGSRAPTAILEDAGTFP
jgi:hypothetical protein